MTLEDWLNNELEALDRHELIALLIDFAYTESSTLEELADFVDNWSKHS